MIGAAYSIIFLVFNVLPDLHREKKENEEMVERLIAQPSVFRKRASMMPSEGQAAAAAIINRRKTEQKMYEQSIN